MPREGSGGGWDVLELVIVWISYLREVALFLGT